MPDPTLDLHRLHLLISRHVDGLISSDEHSELVVALESDSDARKQWFLRNDIDVAVAGRAVGDHENAIPLDAQVVPGDGAPKRIRAATLAGPVLAALGVVVGVFGASAVWAFTLPRSAGQQAAIRVFTDSFESGIASTMPSLPRGLHDPAGDAWRGDDAVVVTTRQGVRPATGSQMLAFQRSTHAGENPSASSWSDVYRFVDARPFLVLAGEQPVTARLIASFAIAPDACAQGEAYAANVQMYAFDHDLADAPTPLALDWIRENCVASGMKRVPLKSGRGEWQRVAVDASLPPDARFVLMHVAAVRERPKPTSEPVVFRGHFIDDVSLELHVKKTAR